MTQRRYAEVAVNLPLDGSYTYAIPKHLDLKIGHRAGALWESQAQWLRR